MTQRRKYGAAPFANKERSAGDFPRLNFNSCSAYGFHKWFVQIARMLNFSERCMSTWPVDYEDYLDKQQGENKEQVIWEVPEEVEQRMTPSILEEFGDSSTVFINKFNVADTPKDSKSRSKLWSILQTNTRGTDCAEDALVKTNNITVHDVAAWYIKISEVLNRATPVRAIDARRRFAHLSIGDFENNITRWWRRKLELKERFESLWAELHKENASTQEEAAKDLVSDLSLKCEIIIQCMGIPSLAPKAKELNAGMVKATTAAEALVVLQQESRLLKDIQRINTHGGGVHQASDVRTKVEKSKMKRTSATSVQKPSKEKLKTR
jgi:hypothetical protein